MERLNRETLARLVDETPTAEERRALEADPSARAELQALRDQTEALESLPDVLPPRVEWEELEGRLMGAGLIRSPRPQIRTRYQPAWLQIAAALVIFAGGTAIGVGFTRGAPDGGQSTPARTAATFAASPVDMAVDEAAETVRNAEERYIEALMRYRQLVEGSSTEPRLNDPASRFAHSALWQALKSCERIEDAILALRRGRGAFPSDAEFTCLLAWTLAVTPGAELIDEDEAVRLANQCLSAQPNHPRHHDVLAAALAARGDFAEAVKTATHAISLARDPGLAKFRGEIEARLELYKARKAYRE